MDKIQEAERLKKQIVDRYTPYLKTELFDYTGNFSYQIDLIIAALKLSPVSEHSSAGDDRKGVRGSIYYEVSEDEIQKEISDYKNNVKLEASTFTDDEIRDFCIKSLVSYKVGLQSYTNPENIKPNNKIV